MKQRHCPECFGKDNFHERQCKLAKEMKKNTLTAVPVLAEPLDQKLEPVMSETGKSGKARESTESERGRPCSDSRGGSQKPSEATAADWKEACERAQRATDYAAMFSIHPLDTRYQDPMWQWENRVHPFDRRKPPPR